MNGLNPGVYRGQTQMRLPRSWKDVSFSFSCFEAKKVESISYQKRGRGNSVCDAVVIAQTVKLHREVKIALARLVDA